MPTSDSRSRMFSSRTRADHWWLFLVLFAAVLPNIIWSVIDKTAWPWDQAWYAKYSVELFFTLIYSPSEWIPAMLNAFGRQAPGIAWAGQFFVPVGLLTGSIDTGLLLSIVCAQIIALFLMARALWELSERRLRGRPRGGGRHGCGAALHRLEPLLPRRDDADDRGRLVRVHHGPRSKVEPHAHRRSAVAGNGVCDAVQGLVSLVLFWSGPRRALLRCPARSDGRFTEAFDDRGNRSARHPDRGRHGSRGIRGIWRPSSHTFRWPRPDRWPSSTGSPSSSCRACATGWPRSTSISSRRLTIVVIAGIVCATGVAFFMHRDVREGNFFLAAAVGRRADSGWPLRVLGELQPRRSVSAAVPPVRRVDRCWCTRPPGSAVDRRASRSPRLRVQWGHAHAQALGLIQKTPDGARWLNPVDDAIRTTGRSWMPSSPGHAPTPTPASIGTR